MRNMARQVRAVLTMTEQFLDGKKARLCERRINGRSGMSFTENEPIALRPLWVFGPDAQHSAIQDSDDIGNREARGDMRASASARHFNDVPANARREFRRCHEPLPPCRKSSRLR